MREKVRLRHDVEPGTRTHFSFQMMGPEQAGRYQMKFFLTTLENEEPGETEAILDMSIRGHVARLIVPLAVRTRSYGVAYLEHDLPDRLSAGTVCGARLSVENRSERVWRRDHPEGKSVDLTVWIDGKVRATHALPRPEVKPGGATSPSIFLSRLLRTQARTSSCWT